MRSTTVLYDGWPLVYEPYGPAAMHLQALLAHLPAHIEATVALPGPAPAWLDQFRIHIQNTPAGDSGQLQWEQRLLPRFAQQVGAQILHLTSPGAPLLGKVIRVISPGAYEGGYFFRGQSSLPDLGRRKEKASAAGRLRLSLGQGGLARARAVFWPDDAPDPELPVPVVKLPPVVHPSFTSMPLQVEMPKRGPNGHPRLESERIANPEPEDQAQMHRAFDLPESYVLYHGPSSLYWLQRLLESWHWASSPVGDQYPLLILGMPDKQRDVLSDLVRRFDLGETVRALPDVSVETLPAIYRGCSAFFHPAPFSPWGDPVRNALACGKPVVAAESRLADAIVGPAAYLAPSDDPRALGAALLTVIVEEEVAGELAQNARQRSGAWRSAAFSHALDEVYRRILSRGES